MKADTHIVKDRSLRGKSRGAWMSWLTGVDIVLVFAFALAVSLLFYDAKITVHQYTGANFLWNAVLAAVCLFGFAIRTGRNLLFIIGNATLAFAVLTYGRMDFFFVYVGALIPLFFLLCLFNGWAWRSWLALPRVRRLKKEEREYVKRTSGLTLIELLIVIAILGLMASGMIRVQARARITEQHLDGMTRAAAIASSQIEMLVNRGGVSQDADGLMELPVPVATLDSLPECEAVCHVEPGPEEDLARVTVQVRWKERTGAREFELTRLLRRIQS